MESSAAHEMLSQILPKGWEVCQKLEKTDNQTGSFFSVCYLVEKDDERCFMKAFDIMKFSSLTPGNNMMDVMNDMTTAYIYERDLSNYCRDRHVTKVSFVKEAGQVTIPGHTFPVVPYLIFELADGDIRKKLEFSEDLDYAWKFKCIHDVAVGLKQLHAIEVSHQDLKPSNILIFKNESKIGDLGRSMCREIEGPYNKQIFTGDWTYAPPELMYRYYEKDWIKRVYATDCYLLGSLIVFCFAGISMSALLRKHLPDQFSYENWRGTYEELIPYLENSFSSALSEFEQNITRDDLKYDLKLLVSYLCNPFPSKRGHPKNILLSDNYGLERFISKLDYLRMKAEIKVKKQ